MSTELATQAKVIRQAARLDGEIDCLDVMIERLVAEVDRLRERKRAAICEAGRLMEEARK